MVILKDLRFWLMAFIGFIYVFLIYNFRWISSDGLSVVYQSYNVINGLGLVWNFGERTYVSTSPLFTVSSIPLTYILDFFFGLLKVPANKIIHIPIIINLIFAISSFLVIIKFSYSKIKELPISKLIIVLTIFSLVLSSKFYIDFSTSGLENSLSFLVISLFTVAAFKENTSEKEVHIPILVSLVFLTRYDFLLIILPTIVLYLYQKKITRSFITMCLIITSWFLFSLFYFGSIFPNSFYIKTRGFNLYQSLFYLKANIFESIEMFILLALGFYCSYNIKKPIFIGMFLYLFYILAVKDYMFGRLFTVLVPISIISIIYYISKKNILNKNLLVISSVGTSIISIVLFVPTIVKLYTFKITESSFPITNERYYYTIKDNLLESNLVYKKPSPNINSINVSGSMLHEPLIPNISNDYFLDPIGLASPFMTYYIKNYNSTGTRPGHYFADMNYLKSQCVFETIINNKNIIPDKNLSELYDDVKIISTGKLFDTSRLKAIIKLNTHSYNRKIKQ